MFTDRSKSMLLPWFTISVIDCLFWWFVLFWVAVWPIFGKNCSLGFLLVVFWLWCRCFKCVLLSLWCLGTEGVRLLYRFLIIAFLSIHYGTVDSGIQKNLTGRQHLKKANERHYDLINHNTVAVSRLIPDVFIRLSKPRILIPVFSYISFQADTMATK